MLTPVIYFDLSLARNKTAFAISSGLPILPRSISSFNKSISLFVRELFISVSITPGDTQLTRIPLGANSYANALVKPIKPALEAE